MISVTEAIQLILSSARPLSSESVALADAGGRVLRQSLIADRDYPPFDRVAMDGYALSSSAWQMGLRRFRVQGMQTAGQKPLTLEAPDACIEIMTGAKLAGGCDFVIRYEDSERAEGHNTVTFTSDLEGKPYTNVHRLGVDCPAGQAFIDKVMTAPIGALAASFGFPTLAVSKKARITILGTGDELVAIDKQPNDYQIRASNIHAIRMALEMHGHEVILCRTLADDRTRIMSAVKDALASSEMLVLSGGVSAGKTDFIPAVLQDSGVRKIFHKIAQKPGKPLWFGQTESGTSVFGLPGNPVSSLICLYVYAIPHLKRMQRLDETPRPIVELLTPRPKGQALTHFIPVTIRYERDARITAEGRGHHVSGDFASLSGTQGFLRIPGESDADFDAQSRFFTFYSW